MSDTNTDTTELEEKLIKALASIEKLTTKNAELVEREKKAKLKADEAEEARETAAEDAARKANDLEALEKSIERKYAKQIETLTAERDAATKQLDTLVIDGGIKDALTAANVPAHLHKPLTAQFKLETSLKDGAAMLNGEPLADALKTYFAGDEGKAFVSAPNNTGAGATGSTTAPKGHGFTRDNFASKRGEWAALAATSPAEAKQIALECGQPSLANTIA